MDQTDLLEPSLQDGTAFVALRVENEELRAEIRVAHEAAEITARMVVEEFEKADRLMNQVQEKTRELEKFNEDLAGANRKLSELDRLKSDFLSSVSHELRTPLTSIRGFAKLVGRDIENIFSSLQIADEKLRAKAGRIHQNLAIIQDEGERLTRLINDVLDLAKIESGRIEWNIRSSDMGKVVQQAVSASSGQFADKPDVELRVDLAPDLPHVMIDHDRMVQVLINLLNNAAKFTHAGFVEIKVERRAEDGWLLVSVRDTGEGFPQQDAEIVFDKFRQVIHGDTLRDKPKGTGLGLAICREIVEHFKGRIWAASQPGAGTTMSIALPPGHEVEAGASQAVFEQFHPAQTRNEPVKAVSAQAVSSERLLPLILVVDDDENVCRYLAQLLNQEGYQVVTAMNGCEAVELAKTKHPDLVTMDIAMPVMDGDTAIAQFRRDQELRHIPVVVVSALPSRDKSAGDAVLGKPVDERLLLETIRNLLTSQLDPTQAAPSTDVSAPCLVLCQDTPPQQMPPYIRTGQAQYCRLSDFMVRVRDGFEGMVVIPTDMLRHVDFNKLGAMNSVQILVLPNETQAPSVTGEPGP